MKCICVFVDENTVSKKTISAVDENTVPSSENDKPVSRKVQSLLDKEPVRQRDFSVMPVTEQPLSDKAHCSRDTQPGITCIKTTESKDLDVSLTKKSSEKETKKTSKKSKVRKRDIEHHDKHKRPEDEDSGRLRGFAKQVRKLETLLGVRNSHLLISKVFKNMWLKYKSI